MQEFSTLYVGLDVHKYGAESLGLGIGSCVRPHCPKGEEANNRRFSDIAGNAQVRSFNEHAEEWHIQKSRRWRAAGVPV